ncbi:hypothetical protein [Telluribacter humicola]|uniref:hypothetical protein n=1 Tax=Telluribacter humicola TaxID=1720261 RepID=UPI001A96082D|nr:hypothetical protein [Telluribacter humicola]
MNPFNKLVGFAPVATGRLLVNALPGISEELGSALVRREDVQELDDPGQEGLAGVWNRISGLAYDMLLLELECILSEKGAFRHELVYTKPLALGQNILEAGNVYEYRIETSAMRFTRLKIDQVTVRTVEEGVVTLKLIDVTLTKSLYETIFEHVADITDLPFPCDITNDRGLNLLLQVSSTAGLVDFSGIISPESHTCIAAALCIQDNNLGDAVSNPFMDASIKLGGDLSALVKRNAELLAPAYQYACGYQFMLEKLSSHNFNLFTNTNLIVTEENRDSYKKQFKSYLTRGAAVIAKQLENSYTLEATPDETGGWSKAGLI